MSTSKQRGSLYSEYPTNTLLATNLPDDATEEALQSLFSRYGIVKGVEILPQISCALIEFESVQTVVKMVTLARKHPFYIQDNHSVLEFSSRSTNTTRNIVEIRIDKAKIPITITVVYNICSLYGNLMKILIEKDQSSTSKCVVRVFVEYETYNEAALAILALNDGSFFSKDFSVHAKLSSLQFLNVKQNSEYSWDCSTDSSKPNSKIGLLGDHPTDDPVLSNDFAQSMCMGNGSGGPSIDDAFDIYDYKAFQNMARNTPIAAAVGGLQQAPFMNNNNNALMSSFMNSAGTELPAFQYGEGVVVVFNNLPLVHMNCDKLFNICCLYGNVAKIKFLKSRPGTAMVQMGSKEAAQTVYNFLRNFEVFHESVYVGRSKQPRIVDDYSPFKLEDGTSFVKNFTSSPNNRFRSAATIVKARILPPSKTLHFFNTPPFITDEHLVQLFLKNGCQRPSKIVVFPLRANQKNSIGLVEWESLNDTFEALAIMNNYEIEVTGIPHPFHMKLTFSSKPIDDDKLAAASLYLRLSGANPGAGMVGAGAAGDISSKNSLMEELSLVDQFKNLTMMSSDISEEMMRHGCLDDMARGSEKEKSINISGGFSKQNRGSAIISSAENMPNEDEDAYFSPNEYVEDIEDKKVFEDVSNNEESDEKSLVKAEEKETIEPVAADVKD